jgi:hypothetical protein
VQSLLAGERDHRLLGEQWRDRDGAVQQVTRGEVERIRYEKKRAVPEGEAPLAKLYFRD